jgi:hypothetical protein
MFLVSVIWSLPETTLIGSSFTVRRHRRKFNRHSQVPVKSITVANASPKLHIVTETKGAPMVRDFLRHQCIERDGGSFELRITKLAV